ncbi:hypothetical protein D3C83_103140 [compost metagenome]
MLLQPEDGRTALGVVAADAFEKTRAVMHGVGEHMDLRVGKIDEPAVHPHFFDFFEWHWNPPGTGYVGG